MAQLTRALTLMPEKDDLQRTISITNGGVKVKPERPASSTPNAIRTTRFSLLTWLPKSLWLQFHRIANLYFVFIAVVACTPLWGHKASSKVITVVSILFIQALKDLYEDRKRKRDDDEVNARQVKSYDAKHRRFVDTEWQACDAGYVLLVEKGASFPCDLLIVASSETSGNFYLSTKSLDGETNLKERRAPQLGLNHLQDADELGVTSVPSSSANQSQLSLASQLMDCGLRVTLEAPHASLLDMSCSYSSAAVGTEEAPDGLSIDNFALRGCDLQATSWVLGIAAYVGSDTKVILNSSPAPTKTSELERFLNNCVAGILVFIFGVSFYFAVASVLVEAPDKIPVYEVFFKYCVILYAVLPMTLYIMFEILHLIIGRQIEIDELMFDADTDSYAKARNTSIVEELGQVDFVFSDKTGTLTANEMRFAACCVGTLVLERFLLSSDTGFDGQDVSRVRQALAGTGSLGQQGQISQVADFFEALAVCHTVKIDEDGTYQGESPDEVALVDVANSVGYRLKERRVTEGVTVHRVQNPQGVVEDHKVAHVLTFTSDRKRMSVVCRTDDGGAVVTTKGADNIMEDLLLRPLPQEAHTALSHFSRQGLRTLVVGRRKMDVGTYSAWRRRWDQASAAIEGRAEHLARVSAEAETDLAYVGITALEDRLQDGVPATIAALREAGIRVWVLTGDKVETAVEIAKSCKLFEDGMQIAWGTGASSSQDAINKLRTGFNRKDHSTRGMVLDGISVARIMEDEKAKSELYEIAEDSSSCVCCRLSPLQKRELVEMVRSQNPSAITLSIGDGANDVPMIQGAHIGVGIRGKEGSASVQACDVAISQFRFLGNLVFCHGRKAYRRIATFLCFFIYKSVVLGWSYIIYAHAIRFAGDLAYPEWLDILYNPITSIGAVLLLANDSDYKDETALRNPQLYLPGPARKYLSALVFAKWMAFASLHGILAWSIPVYFLTTYEERHEKPSSDAFWQASFTAFSLIIIIIHLKLVIVAVKPMQCIGIVVVALETFAFVPIAAFLGSPLGTKLTKSPEMLGVPQSVISSPRHLIVLALVPCIAILADLLEAAVVYFMLPWRTVGAELKDESSDDDDDASSE